jgi:FkbM family methyltransferase
MRLVAKPLARLIEKSGHVITKPWFPDENEIDVRALLADSTGKKGSQFSVVQIGANDGLTNDPIGRLVKERGWSLVAVEPQPAAFERLKNTYCNYPNVRCVECAIGHEDGEATLYTLKPSPKNGNEDDQYASFLPDLPKKQWRHILDVQSRIVPIKVRTRKLSSLLGELGVGCPDMLQIDAEGFDFEIVKMAFGQRLFPRILAFEWVHLSKADMWAARCELIKYGYRWLRIKVDVVAARQSE